MDIVPEQRELSRELPQIVGNADYTAFEQQLRRMDELLIQSGAERDFVVRGLAHWKESGRAAARECGERYREPGVRAILHQQKTLRQAFRCMIARELTEKPYRRFTRRLAESELLRWFCGIERMEMVRVPSKSTLKRYDALLPESEIRAVIDGLNRRAGEGGGITGQPLGLEQPCGIEVCLVDTTCLKANIHFPVDWVLLRDAVRTLMKAVKLIRGKGLKHRMEEPEHFLRQINRLSMEMTHSRRRADSLKARKRALRRMKRLSKCVAQHGERYRELLDTRWTETDWTRKQAQQVIDRMQRVLDQLPEAMRQAHERIIGRRKVANADKILSLYEADVHVIVRGKASAEIEFGNTLFVAEQSDGLVVDWKLLQDASPGDAALLEESLERMRENFGRYPLGVGADRGFARRATARKLDDLGVYDGTCPRDPRELRERMREEAFQALQLRRAQTEGRIGILKNGFLGDPLRSKGFRARERAVSWAVLAHNLWVLARLPRAAAHKKAA